MESKKAIERINSVLSLDKLSNPMRFSKVLSSEIENVLLNYMKLASKPCIDINVINNKYEIKINVFAHELKTIN